MLCPDYAEDQDEYRQGHGLLDRQDAGRVPRREDDHPSPIRKPLSVRQRFMVLILESYCRDKPYTWVGNRELAAAYGCAKCTVQELLKSLEEDRIIRRVAAQPGQPGRSGSSSCTAATPTCLSTIHSPNPTPRPA